MSDQGIEIPFKVSMQGSAQAVFNQITSGLQKLVKGLQQAAKAQLELQNTDVANSIGHTALALNKVLASLAKTVPGTKDLTAELQLLSAQFSSVLNSGNAFGIKAQKIFKAVGDGRLPIENAEKALTYLQNAFQKFKVVGGDIQAVKDRLDRLSASTKVGTVEWKAAQAATNSFGAAIGDISNKLKAAGVHEDGWSAKLKESTLNTALNSKELELRGRSFKINSAEGYKALQLSEKQIQALKTESAARTAYRDALRAATEQIRLSNSYGEAYRKTVQDLGKSVGRNNGYFEVYANVLKKAIPALNQFVIANKYGDDSLKKITKNVDLTKLALAAADGQLKITTNGFKVLSSAGLVPFGISSTDVAKKLGILDASFITFENKLNKMKAITGMSAKSFDALKQKVLDTSNSFAEAGTKIDGYISKAVKTKTVTDALNKVYNSFKDVINASNSFGESAKKAFDNFPKSGKTISDLRTRLQELRAELKGDSTALKNFENSLQTLQTVSGLSAEKINKLKNHLLASGKSFTEASVKVDKFVLGFEKFHKITGIIDKLKFQYSNLFTEQNRFTSDMYKAIDAYKRGAIDIKQLDLVMKNWSTSLKNSNALLNTNAAGVSLLRNKYKELLGSATNVGREATTLISTFSKQNGSLKELQTSLAGLNKKYIDHIRYTQAVNKAQTSFGKALNEIARSLRTYARYMLASSILRSFTDGVRNATTTIIDHNQALHDLTAITNATSAEIILMNQALLDTAANSKYSIGEIAQSMKRMGQAGFSASEIIQGIKPITELAVGSLETLSATVDLVTTALRVFNLGMEQTSRVTDVFANAVTKSKLTIQGLNTAMNYIGPVGEQVGLSIEEAASAMSLLADSGLKFSTIGTGMRRFLQNLLKPTKEFEEGIKAAGLSIDDFNPEVVGMAKVLENLPKVVKNATDSVSMFGLRASSIVATFVDKGVDSFNRYMDGIGEVGAAHRMAQEQMEGLRVIIDMIIQKFGVLVVTLSKTLIPVFKSVLSTFNTFMSGVVTLAGTGFGQLISAVTAATVALAALATTMRIMFSVQMITWISSIKTFSTVLLYTRNVMIASQAAAGGYAMGMMTLTGGIKSATAAAWKFVATPLGAAIAISTAAIVGFVTLWTSATKKLEDFITTQTKLQGSLNSLKGQMLDYAKVIKEHGTGSDKAKKANEFLMKSFDDVAQSGLFSKDKIEEFRQKINLLSEDSGDLTKALGEMSDELDIKLKKSLKDAANAGVDLYRSQFTMRNGTQWTIKTFKDFVKWSEGSSTAMAETGLEGDKLAFTLGGKVKNALYSIISPMKDVFTTVKDSTEAYKKLADSAIEGNEKSKAAVQALNASAKSMAKDMMEGIEVTKLSKKEIEEMVIAYAKAENLGKLHVGALIKALDNLLIKEKETAKQKIFDTAQADTLSGAMKKINQEIEQMYPDSKIRDIERFYGDRLKNEQEFRDMLLKKFDGYQTIIKQKRNNELTDTRVGYIKMLLDWKGTQEEKEELTKAFIQRNLQINQKANNEELGLLKKKKQILVDQHEAVIKDYDEYLKIKKGMFDSELDAELTSLDRKHAEEMRKINAQIKGFTVLINGAFVASQGYQQEDIIRDLLTKTKLEIAYYKKKGELERAATAKTIGYLNKEKAKKEEFIKQTVTDEKEAKDKIHELNKTTLSAQISLLKDRKKAYEETVNSLKTLEQSLTDAILAEIAKRKGLNDSLEETLRKGQYASLTDEQIIAKEKIRLAEMVAEAKEAISKGDISTGQDLLAEAAELAAELYGDVADNIKTSRDNLKDLRDEASKVSDEMRKMSPADEGYKDKQKELSDITTQLNEQNNILRKSNAQLKTEEERVRNIYELQRQTSIAAEKSLELEKLKVEKQIKSLETLKNQISTNIKAVETNLLSMTAGYVGSVQTVFEELNSQIEAIEKAPLDTPVKAYNTAMEDAKGITSAVVTKLNEMVLAAQQAAAAIKIAAGAANVPVTGDTYATGGRIPGYGGGDRNPILAEDGEWIIRKEAVRKYGDNFLASLNNMRLPRFSGGGAISPPVTPPVVIPPTPSVFSLDSLKDFGKVVIDTGKIKFPALVNKDVVSELTQHIRKANLMGANI